MSGAGASHPPSTPDEASYRPHRTEDRARYAVFGVLWSALHAAIPVASATLVFFVSVLYLSPSEIGLFGLASSLVISVVAISPVAFGEALVQRQTIARTDADSVFWMAMTAGLVLTLPFLLAARPLSEWTGEPDISAMLPLLAMRIPLDLAASVPNAMIVRSMRFKAIAVRTSLATAVTVSVTVGMLWSGFGVWALVASQVASSLTVCVLAFWTSAWRPRLTFDRHALGRLTSYGLFSSGTRMLTTMRFDHIVLGALGGTAVLGLYFFAQKAYSMLLQLVGGALSSVTHVLLSTLQRDREKTRRAFRIASFTAAAVSFPGFALLAILASDLIGLAFAPSWSAAAHALQLFCIMGCIAGVSVVQGAFIRSQGRADWWFWYQALQQVTTILVVLLTFRSGLDVLMIFLTVKSLLVWPISVAMTLRLLGISTTEYLRTFAAPGLATAAMIGAVMILGQVFSEMNPAASLGVRALSAGLLYIAVLWLCAHGRIREIFHLLVQKRETAP